jgi:hypothetical protein
VAYYYRKEEKLLITDFVEKGSLAVHLHGMFSAQNLDSCQTRMVMLSIH